SGNKFNNLNAGTYQLMVKDVNGCTASSTVILDATTNLTGVITSQTNISCGTTSGSVTVTGAGGTSYTYNIDGGKFSFNNTFNNLKVGSHTVTVKDFWGCTSVVPVNIISVIPTASISGNTTLTACTGNTASFTLNIAATGNSHYSAVYKDNSGNSYTASNLVAGDNTITTAALTKSTVFTLFSVTS